MWAPPQEISTALTCHDFLLNTPGTPRSISNLHLMWSHVYAYIYRTHLTARLQHATRNHTRSRALPAPCLRNLKHSHPSEKIHILACTSHTTRLTYACIRQKKKIHIIKKIHILACTSHTTRLTYACIRQKTYICMHIHRARRHKSSRTLNPKH